ncbi:MAG: periplasmic L-asparaginase [Bacteroidota bacterium]|nr:MAG: periplasmic L-asparaginase [Bacteroidota bacterium]
MKYFSLLLFLVACTNSNQPTEQAEAAIREVLTKQQQAWNEGNLELFMEGYWKSDSLQFIGSSIRYGWQQTLDNYKKNYSTRKLMGQLQFDIWQVVPLGPDAYLLTGKYTLFRESDQPTGPFTLIFKKKNNTWVIVYDHTS